MRTFLIALFASSWAYSIIHFFRKLGAAGLFFLGVLDSSFLVLPFGLLGTSPAHLQCRFGFDMNLPCLLNAGVHGGHAGAQLFHLQRSLLLLRGLARGLRVDFRELADDLFAARFQPFRQLRQSHMVQFQLMLVFLKIR